MDITFHVSNYIITHLLQLYTKQTLLLSDYSVIMVFALVSDQNTTEYELLFRL